VRKPRQRADQRRWKWRLESAGQDYAEWVPWDWRSGQIAAGITALNLPVDEPTEVVITEDGEKLSSAPSMAAAGSAAKHPPMGPPAGQRQDD